MEAKVVLLEVADLEQALRVAQHARNLDIFDGVEIWREQPDASGDAESEQDFAVIGQGNARSVLCWRDRGAYWLGKIAPLASSNEDADRLFRSSFVKMRDAEEKAREVINKKRSEPRFDMEIVSGAEHSATPLRRWPDNRRMSDHSKTR